MTLRNYYPVVLLGGLLTQAESATVAWTTAIVENASDPFVYNTTLAPSQGTVEVPGGSLQLGWNPNSYNPGGPAAYPDLPLSGYTMQSGEVKSISTVFDHVFTGGTFTLGLGWQNADFSIEVLGGDGVIVENITYGTSGDQDAGVEGVGYSVSGNNTQTVLMDKLALNSHSGYGSFTINGTWQGIKISQHFNSNYSSVDAGGHTVSPTDPAAILLVSNITSATFVPEPGAALLGGLSALLLLGRRRR
ncbi:hypothetical protein V2O64_10225 [Verrucomicrobiaceae bacterium 227]